MFKKFPVVHVVVINFNQYNLENVDRAIERSYGVRPNADLTNAFKESLLSKEPDVKVFVAVGKQDPAKPSVLGPSAPEIVQSTPDDLWSIPANPADMMAEFGINCDTDLSRARIVLQKLVSRKNGRFYMTDIAEKIVVTRISAQYCKNGQSPSGVAAAGNVAAGMYPAESTFIITFNHPSDSGNFLPDGCRQEKSMVELPIYHEYHRSKLDIPIVWNCREKHLTFMDASSLECPPTRFAGRMICGAMHLAIRKLISQTSGPNEGPFGPKQMEILENRLRAYEFYCKTYPHISF